MTSSSSSAPPSWFAHLPGPVASPDRVSIQHVFDLLQDGTPSRPGIDFVIVDVRRTDIEAPLDFLIPGAVNLPAQTFHQTLPALYPLLSRVPAVIFHCSSSNGRGPRCAGWYQDMLDAKGEKGSTAFILDTGIKGWAEAHPDLLVRL